MGILWKGANRHGALAALLAGHLAAGSIFVLAEGLGVLIIQNGPLSPDELQKAIQGTPVLHFLYLPFILFVISSCMMVVVSKFIGAPEVERVRDLIWSVDFFRAEEKQLAVLPWYKNYRIQSILLLALTSVFIGMFW